MLNERVFITGTSGTGKSAIVSNLKMRGIAAIDTDAIPQLAHWRHKVTGKKNTWYPKTEDAWESQVEWHQNYRWIIDPARFRDLLAEGDIRIVAGLAFNQSEFDDLFTTTILLQCEEKVFIERIMQREGNRYGKDPAAQQQIIERYKDLETTMINRGAIPINTNKPLNHVVDEILSFI